MNEQNKSERDFEKAWLAIEEYNHNFMMREYKTVDKTRRAKIEVWIAFIREMLAFMLEDKGEISLRAFKAKVTLSRAYDKYFEEYRKYFAKSEYKRCTYSRVYEARLRGLMTEMENDDDIKTIFFNLLLNTYNQANDLTGRKELYTERPVYGAKKFRGQNLYSYLVHNTKVFIADADTSFKRSLLKNDKMEKVIEGIYEAAEADSNRRKSLIATFTTIFTNTALANSAMNFGYPKVKIVEKRDAKTCMFCNDMNGRVVSAKDILTGVTVPPFHNHCRGIVIPYTDEQKGE